MADNQLTVAKLEGGSLDLDTLATFVSGDENAVNHPRLRPDADIGSIAELRKKVQDKVDLQIATLPIGHKGYATLALAQAAQASLPANTLVEVTNDTKASNNGVYLWDGTALTKSAYDPAFLIYDRIGLSFNPKTFVEYLPTNFAVVDGKAKYQVTKPTTGSRSVIIKIDPSKTYTVVKTASDRFRLATFPVLPQEAVLGTVIKGEADGHRKDADLVYFTFTSPIDAQYLVIYVSASNETPTSEIYEGTYNGATFNKSIFRRDVEASNIVKSKNIADEREKNWIRYVFRDDGLSGENASITGWAYPSDGAALLVNVKPNTTYTLSRKGGDRFRVALFKRMGNGGSPTQLDRYRVLSSSNDPQTTEKITFTTNENEFILYAYLTSHVEKYGYPDWVQVEEGKVATEYESFGYKFSPAATPKNKGSSSGTAAYDYAGVGDANYISKAGATAGAWKDSQYTIPATDDTDTLQALFNSAKGVVSLEPNKKYKVTRPIRYNPEKVKLIKGNMAHIVCIGDIETFQMVGTLSSSANAGDMNRSLAYNEMGPMVVALKITNPMEVLGTAFVVSKVMSPIFLACNFAYLRRGIVFRGNNRNAILSSNHIYACSDYGIHFEEGGELHQINIVGNHISYCRKNIFSENHNIYNIQITGGDIETSSYPTLEIGGAAECDMHFLQTTAILEDLEIVGNTIEDHWNTTKMIRLEGNPTTTDKISCVTISGNVTGNSAGSVIEIGGASGVEIVGQFKANRGYVVDVIGNLDGFKLSTQSKQSGGGLFRAVGGYSLKDVTVCGNNLSNSVTQNPILVDVQSLDNCNFSDNDLRVSGVGGFHTTHKAPITIHADTMKLVRVDDNTIANTSSSTKAVEIVARNSSEKGSMRGNMASYGAFTAPESFAISENG